MRAAWIAALLLASCASPFQPVVDSDLAALRASSHLDAWQAMNRAGIGLAVRGQSFSMGRVSPYELLIAGDGRYRLSIEGELGSLEVFDGVDVFRRDFSEIDQRLEWTDRRDAPRLVALLVGQWSQGVLTMASDDRVRVALESNVPHVPAAEVLELNLDPTSLLPTRVAKASKRESRSLMLVDWQAAFGVALPSAIEMYSQTTGALEGRLVMDSIDQVVLDESTFAFRVQPATDVRFESAAPAIAELWRLPSGHLAVPVTINGDTSKVFLLDTGAGATVIDSHYAATLGLASLGDVNAVGVSGSTMAQFVRADSLRVADFVWDVPVLVALDFGGIAEMLGEPVAGVLGFDWISRCQVEVDAEEVRLWPLSTPAPDAEGWHRVELGFAGKTPTVEATFPTNRGAATGRFRVDTGDNGSVTFHGPAIKRYNLLAQRETSPISFGGVGGSSFGYVGELEWFSIAGLRVGPLEAGFATEATGTFAAEDLVGNLGQGLFGVFYVRIDYAARCMLLRARPVAPATSE